MGRHRKNSSEGGVGWNVTHSQENSTLSHFMLLLIESALVLLLITRQNSVSHIISWEENMNPGILALAAAPTAREPSHLQEHTQSHPTASPRTCFVLPSEFSPRPQVLLFLRWGGSNPDPKGFGERLQC